MPHDDSEPRSDSEIVGPNESVPSYGSSHVSLVSAIAPPPKKKRKKKKPGKTARANFKNRVDSCDYVHAHGLQGRRLPLWRQNIPAVD